jgi:copper transport protein
MVHLSAMATWVGGLAVVGIALLPRRDPEELRAVLPVFSRVAFTAVVLLAASGAYAAWRGVGSWRALVETSYGWLVLAKIAGFVALLALGNLARRVIRARVRRPVIAYAMTASTVVEPPRELDEVETERMRRSVLVEVVVAALVLALAAVLVAQPRGADALATKDRAAVHASAPLGDGNVAQLTVDPGRHGVVSVEIAVPERPQSVTATATLPARRIGPLPIRLVGDGPGLYSAAGVELPVAGTWVIALVVTSSRFDAIATDARVALS